MYRFCWTKFITNNLSYCCSFNQSKNLVFLKAPLVCSTLKSSFTFVPSQRANLFLVEHFHSNSIALKAKGKKSDGKIKQVIRTADAAAIVDLDEIQKDMKAVINSLKNDYTIDYRVGSDIPLDQLEVLIEDDKYALNEVAQISKLSSHLIQIDMVDFPEFVSVVKDAICSSKWNLNPSVTGTILKVPLPQATAERRTMIAKAAKQRLTTCKLDLRKIVDDLSKSFKTHDKMTDDFEFILNQQINIYLDHFSSEAESLYKGKEKEILNPS